MNAGIVQYYDLEKRSFMILNNHGFKEMVQWDSVDKGPWIRLNLSDFDSEEEAFEWIKTIDIEVDMALNSLS